jgi:hypothetical protein
MSLQLSRELIEKYNLESKHSQYQRFPEFVGNQPPPNNIFWRDDRPRLALLRREIEFGDLKTLLEVGSNIGYFGLSLKHDHPHLKVYFYEIDQTMRDLSRDLAEMVGLTDCCFFPEAFDCTTKNPPDADLLLCMNVLHHIGRDYGPEMTPDMVKSQVQEEMTFIRSKCRQLSFQIGMNWGGNKQTPIWPQGSERDYVCEVHEMLGSAGFRDIRLFSPMRSDDMVQYVEADLVQAGELSLNTLENGLVGEFYKRPIFLAR